MNESDVRRAVARYLTGDLTEAEAARRAGIPRARFREYARTCGIVASPPSDSESTAGAQD
jgi:hypothetical protein